MAQVLNQDSTYGSPNVNYKLDLTYSGRTASSITISYTLTATLLYSSSWIGNGYGLKAYIYAGNNYTSHVLVSEWNDTWEYSDGSRKLTGSFTVSGLSGGTSSIATALYVEAVNGYSDSGGQLNKTSGSALSIPTMSYTVTFVNGLGTTLKTQTVSYGGSATPPSNPTRTGYTFNGWSGTYTSVTSNRTITATWKANTYAVTYNANGGSGAPSADTKTYGTILTLSNTIPTREGYNFLGWATSSTATTPTYYAGGSYTTNAAVTLYAVWELANGKSSISLSSSAVRLGGDIIVNISSMDASNTHTVVWSCGDKTWTSHTECTESFTMKLDNATFIEWLGEDKSIDITVTVTTYSGSTNLGSVSASFRYYIPERRYKRGFYVFTNGEWKYCKAYVYLEEKDLVSKDGYEITDADGLELKGDDSWENIR